MWIDNGEKYALVGLQVSLEARTVLVLESGDPALVHFEFRGNLLPSLLAGCENPPDEIFLVETTPMIAGRHGC